MNIILSAEIIFFNMPKGTFCKMQGFINIMSLLTLSTKLRTLFSKTISQKFTQGSIVLISEVKIISTYRNSLRYPPRLFLDFLLKYGLIFSESNATKLKRGKMNLPLFCQQLTSRPLKSLYLSIKMHTISQASTQMPNRH